VIGRLQGAAATRPWLTAVDVFHIEKEGNNVRVRSATRIDLRRERADAYGRARAAYWSAAFRRRRITSILEDDKPWWTGFGRLCATAPQELTIEDSKFRHDCRIAFTEVEMTEAKRGDEKTLEQLIYEVVRTYVFGRLDSKHGMNWEKNVKGRGEGKEKDYNDKKEKIARGAFLAVRSRTGMAFVNYFTGTICSVSQWLNNDSYLKIAAALAPGNDEKIERVRSLTLLALSATG
jgi:CRISPR-associated protein Cmx8